MKLIPFLAKYGQKRNKEQNNENSDFFWGFFLLQKRHPNVSLIDFSAFFHFQGQTINSSSSNLNPKRTLNLSQPSVH